MYDAYKREASKTSRREDSAWAPLSSVLVANGRAQATVAPAPRQACHLHGCLKLRAHCDVVWQMYLCVEVQDTGIGIKDGDRASLFKPFQQLGEAVHTRAHTGTGLGLSISRKLCRLMNGDIRVQSRFGKVLR